ncbi:MAG TPA: bifunctional pyr operon transcriptional regulator/uracil phosphoribosyltransferase PyrR [Haliangium sp.]|nr:bifunctional pyr operon transcriptional regulator/uracil phosphoribosyltransferase PyrR [Haliangium sp.]
MLADGSAAERILRRIAHEIAERNHGVSDLALVGIRTGGLVLAERLRALLGELEGAAPPLGAVDISLYRDDVFQGLPRPEIGPTELPFELSGVTVVLVDDVLYTGRTVRAALDALMDYGRPRAVRLAVLVDRGLRELPIGADHVGLQAETTPDEVVKVLFDAGGAVARVVLARRAARTTAPASATAGGQGRSGGAGEEG